MNASLIVSRATAMSAGSPCSGSTRSSAIGEIQVSSALQSPSSASTGGEAGPEVHRQSPGAACRAACPGRCWWRSGTATTARWSVPRTRRPRATPAPWSPARRRRPRTPSPASGSSSRSAPAGTTQAAPGSPRWTGCRHSSPPYVAPPTFPAAQCAGSIPYLLISSRSASAAGGAAPDHSGPAPRNRRPWPGRAAPAAGAGSVPPVPERVRRPPRHQQEVPGPAGQLGRVQPEGDRPVQHEERLRAVHVPVRRRDAGPRRHGPLHQREVAAGLRRDRLERHHVPARGQQVPLPRWHDARSCCLFCLGD